MLKKGFLLLLGIVLFNTSVMGSRWFRFLDIDQRYCSRETSPNILPHFPFWITYPVSHFPALSLSLFSQPTPYLSELFCSESGIYYSTKCAAQRDGVSTGCSGSKVVLLHTDSCGCRNGSSRPLIPVEDCVMHW
jgi:hypothetical protein